MPIYSRTVLTSASAIHLKSSHALMLITDASKPKRYQINALIVKVNVQSINQSKHIL